MDYEWEMGEGGSTITPGLPSSYALTPHTISLLMYLARCGLDTELVSALHEASDLPSGFVWSVQGDVSTSTEVAAGGTAVESAGMTTSGLAYSKSKESMC